MEKRDLTNRYLYFAQLQMGLLNESADDAVKLSVEGAVYLYLQKALTAWIEELRELVGASNSPSTNVWQDLQVLASDGGSPEFEMLAELAAKPGSWLFQLKSDLKNLDSTLSHRKEKRESEVNPGSPVISVVMVEDTGFASKVVDKLLSDMKEYIEATRTRHQEW